MYLGLRLATMLLSQSFRFIGVNFPSQPICPSNLLFVANLVKYSRNQYVELEVDLDLTSDLEGWFALFFIFLFLVANLTSVGTTTP